MQKERVILLKRTKYSEADLILRGITSRGAKVHLFARAALKSKKRFGGGVLEPFHYVEVIYQRGKTDDEGKLRPINDALLIKDFAGVRADYTRLQAGMFMLQAVDHWCKEGDTDGEALFHLLGQSLKSLEKVQNIQGLRVQFWAKLLWIQGVLENAQDFAALLSRPVAEADELDLSPRQLEPMAGQIARITP